MSQIEEITKAEAKLIIEYIKYLEQQKNRSSNSITVGADIAYKRALNNLERLISE